MTKSLPIPVTVPTGDNLSNYIAAVNAAPILSAENERELAIRYHEHGDLEAAKELVLSHLRHVVKVARGFMGYGLPLTDLIQEGSIGLMKAVKRFDARRDIRLVSFAVHWIRAEIYDYVLRNWRMVKVATTKSQRKLFFNLRKSRAKLGWMKDSEVQKLAEDLMVETDTVREMESRLSGGDVSFDATREQDEGDMGYQAPAEHIGDTRYDPARVISESQQARLHQQQLTTALQTLDDRSKDIVLRRWLSENKPTLHDLADEYGVSAERIRQIEKKAMEKMRVSIEAA